MMRQFKLALLSGVCLTTAANAATSGWTISEASSGVIVVHAGVSKTAMRGGNVQPGDIVTTGQNARAVLVNGDQYAVVSPNSRLEIADPRPSGGLMQFIEKIGNAVFSVQKGAAPHFGVQTPYLAAVVKGTTFSVTVDDSGASVQVIEGAVEVATIDGGAHQLLQPGAIATVGAADLGKLTIQGKGTQVLRSPHVSRPPAARSGAAPAVHTAPTAPVPAVIAEAAAEGHAAPAAAPVQLAAAEPVTINVPIEEAPKSIGPLSGGLVSGTTAMTVAVASAAGEPADSLPAAPGSGNGATSGNGNSAANGNGNGSGSDTGSGNAGDKGNAGQGNAGGNGTGAANGNAGGDGSGAGQGNGGDHGNGGGNGNGGDHGNGGGNGNGGDHGNGGGNGNGGDNGNGNGAGHGNGGGDGNGAGHGNGGGDGNGAGHGNGGGHR